MENRQGQILPNAQNCQQRYPVGTAESLTWCNLIKKKYCKVPSSSRKKISKEARKEFYIELGFMWTGRHFTGFFQIKLYHTRDSAVPTGYLCWQFWALGRIRPCRFSIPSYACLLFCLLGIVKYASRPTVQGGFLLLMGYKQTPSARKVGALYYISNWYNLLK